MRFLLVVLVVAFCFVGTAAAGPVSYSTHSTAGVSLHVIEVDLNDPYVVVSPALASGGVGRDESFGKFIQRLRPVAAINGTYFSKRNRRPVGDIVVQGKLACFGGMGTALAISNQGVDFIRLRKSRHVDWSGYKMALAGGPLLVWEGFAKPMPGGEGFGDPHVFARAAPRTAVGITKNNHLLLVTTIKGTSLAKLARAMRALGAIYAINLDGGASAGMWYAGNSIVSPRRRLTNVLCIYVRPEPSFRGALRPPRGVDWRSGARRLPILSFTAAGIKIKTQLPEKWEGKQLLCISATKPLTGGCLVSVRLDDELVTLTGSLPAEVGLNLDELIGPKHLLKIALLDAEGKTLGSARKIFETYQNPKLGLLR